MNWTKNVWREEVAGYLFELSNIGFQKSLWLGKIPGYQSDFSDVINGIEECGIPDYLDDFVGDGYLEKSQAELLKHLNSLLDQTGEHSSPEEFDALWNSKLWVQIAALSEQLFNESFALDFKKSGKPCAEWLKMWPLPSSKRTSSDKD